MDLVGYVEAWRSLPHEASDKYADSAVGPWGMDAQQVSVAIVLVALACMYSVHNLIAPNMTAIANSFHFNAYERDAYVGGELTLFFYLPGVFGALFAGVLSGVLDRRLLLSSLAVSTGVACLATARVGTFNQLLMARAVSGLCIGGSLPVVYSLVGDWYPARHRASATAFVTAASGAGVFAGQCFSTVLGATDWRLPFFLIFVICCSSGSAIWYVMEEPSRGSKEDGVETLSLYQNVGLHYAPVFGTRHIRALAHNHTNLLVLLQAFPGNIPWGVIIVYIHDFLLQDLGLSTSGALAAITTLAVAAFAGVLCGGFVGERLYHTNPRYLALFGGICNIARAMPFFVLFGWHHWFGAWGHASESSFFTLLMIGGFIATMASPCTGAMLLNVNLPETRGSIMAMYSVLDDLSKGFGTLFVAMIVRSVGGRAVAYQISLLVWVLAGIALLFTWYTYDKDEEQMRQHLEAAAMESMVVFSKQRAQQAVRHRARAAGEAHFAQRNGISAAASASAGSGLLAPPAVAAVADVGRGVPPWGTYGACLSDVASPPTSWLPQQAWRASPPAPANHGRGTLAAVPAVAFSSRGFDRDRLHRAAQAAAAAVVRPARGGKASAAAAC